MKIARVYIDHSKLMEQIKKMGLTANRVAIGIGYCGNFFYVMSGRGYFSKEVAERLEHVYGIKRKSYEIPAPQMEEPKPIEEPKPERAEEPKCSIDYVALYNTIYQAVLTALQENAKGLHDRLFEVK